MSHIITVLGQRRHSAKTPPQAVYVNLGTFESEENTFSMKNEFEKFAKEKNLPDRTYMLIDVNALVGTAVEYTRPKVPEPKASFIGIPE